MSTLDYRTAGESHGKALTVLVEGLPAGVRVDLDLINGELKRRQGGYGRGGRMKIEHDAVDVLSGVRRGVSIGSPLVMQIANRDFRIDDAPAIHRPRPGHADLAGSLKWLTTDCRETLERASARETAARVAAGALAKCLLREFGVVCVGFVASIGTVTAAIGETASPASPGMEKPTPRSPGDENQTPKSHGIDNETPGSQAIENQTPGAAGASELIASAGSAELAGAAAVAAAATVVNSTPEGFIAARDANEAYTPDAAAAAKMIEAIRQAKRDGDTLGGIVETRVYGLPPGLGSCMRWQDKLDGRLMQAVGSIQAFKGVEIGLGFEAARRPGSQVHDAITFDAAQRGTPNLGFVRPTNRAGGLEGGMTNGATLIVRGAMKPISTLMQGMDSVNLTTLAAERSDYERSDVCAAPAASVVMENVVAFEIARAWLDKFAGDTLGEVRAAHALFLAEARRLGAGSESA